MSDRFKDVVGETEMENLRKEITSGRFKTEATQMPYDAYFALIPKDIYKQHNQDIINSLTGNVCVINSQGICNLQRVSLSPQTTPLIPTRFYADVKNNLKNHTVSSFCEWAIIVHGREHLDGDYETHWKTPDSFKDDEIIKLFKHLHQKPLEKKKMQDSSTDEYMFDVAQEMLDVLSTFSKKTGEHIFKNYFKKNISDNKKSVSDYILVLCGTDQFFATLAANHISPKDIPLSTLFNTNHDHIYVGAKTLTT